jgi:hypothetical protein
VALQIEDRKPDGVHSGAELVPVLREVLSGAFKPYTTPNQSFDHSVWTKSSLRYGGKISSWTLTIDYR